MEQRLDVKLEADEEPKAAEDKPKAAKEAKDEPSSMAEAEEKVKKLIKAGKLDNDMVQDAIENNERNFVLQALLQNGRIPLSVIQKAIEARNGRLVTALVWRANFSMRTAVQIGSASLRERGCQDVSNKGG